MNPIDRLRDEIARSELLTAPQSADGFVFGTGRLRSLGADVTVNVDPELDDRSDLDTGVLLAAVERLLTVTSEQWERIVDSIAEEIEEAVGGQPVQETTDLRDDLALESTVVFHDAVLLCLASPKQFPDSWIRAQLDEELAVDEVAVDEKDDDTEAVEFGSLDDLLDHLSDDR